MNIALSQQHHPSTSQLTEFASGTLALSKALCVSAHIEHCPLCQKKIAELNALGGILFNQNTASEVSSNVKAKTMQKLSSITASDDQTQRTTNNDNSRSLPRCLAKFIPSGLHDLSWKSITPKAQIAELCNDNGAKIALIKIDAGAKMAHHNHTGEEITVVLKGSFSDEDGIYKKGDFIVRNAKDHHTPIASRDSECICLIVLDSAIELRGFFGWLINPFLRRWHLAH